MLINLILLKQNSKQKIQNLNIDFIDSQIRAFNHCAMLVISGGGTKTISYDCLLATSPKTGDNSE